MDAHHLSGKCGRSGKRSGHGYNLRHIKSPWSNAIGGDADALDSSREVRFAVVRRGTG
jgi:hypothetical protein